MPRPEGAAQTLREQAARRVLPARRRRNRQPGRRTAAALQVFANCRIMFTPRPLTHSPTYMKFVPDPGRLTGAMMLLTPPLAILVPLFLTVVLLTGALLVLAARAFDRRIMDVTLPGVLLFGLLVWAAISIFWTTDPGAAIPKFSGTVALVVAGLVFLSACSPFGDNQQRFCLAGNCLALCILGGALVLVPVWTADEPDPLVHFNRGLGFLAIAIWPAIAVATRRLFGVALYALPFCLFFAFESNAALAAMLLGGAAFAAVYAAPRISGRAMVSVIAAYMLAAPVIHKDVPPPGILSLIDLPQSAHHRLVIWSYTTDRIVERPLLGWGFYASRRVSEITSAKPLERSLHPHNVALQLWLELGTVGGLLGAALFAAIADRVRRLSTDRLRLAAAAASCISAFTIAQVGYGLWQSWWLAALFLCAGFVMITCGANRSPNATPTAG